MSAYKMEWNHKDEPAQKSMFIVDKDSDPLNNDMLLFEKTQFNEIHVSQLHCS